MPYGMTGKQIDDLATKLGEKLNVDAGRVYDAIQQITREEVLRIAKNEIKKEGK